ncbi:hypothetical protein KIK06_02535 [Nocardiopsis sp. EMB25]|uniref:hypothetical protein n=1 Tax=Nocardiopsis sp. EMB25 TaxID=2835867 RepID=UPI00228533B3|nr:hypothetical protein [Nocardiopsis sp. EMB25]MCY9782767.1 hypothetical protein [Nocardiopsis sp. EMB25]
MPGIPELPTPILPQAWAEVDTSVDNEPPEVLAPHQFERYCATIRDLVAASGLDVDDFGFTPARCLVVQDTDLGLFMKLELHPDRTVDCEFTLEDELLDPSPTVDLATRVVRLFHQGRRLRKARLEES